MRISINSLAPTLLLVLGLAMSGPSSADGFVSEFTTQPSDASGTLVGEMTPIAQDIYPVKITTINGRHLPTPRDVVWLKPGEYEIDATILSHRFQRSTPGPTTAAMQRRFELEPLHLVVEEGKQYRIGGHHLYDEEGSRRRAWALVLWKVVDESGEETYPLEEDDAEEGDENTESDGEERVETDSD